MLRFCFFNIAPIVVEVVLVIGAIAYLYAPKFFWLNLASMLMYFFVTIAFTEYRAKFFKDQAKKDAAYTQRATDSLLNFETVKYFNAENHEQKRFAVSLAAYKIANVTVAKSLVTLNMSQATVIAAGLCSTLMLAYQELNNPLIEFDVSDFIVFNLYVL